MAVGQHCLIVRITIGEPRAGTVLEADSGDAVSIPTTAFKMNYSKVGNRMERSFCRDWGEHAASTTHGSKNDNPACPLPLAEERKLATAPW